MSGVNLAQAIKSATERLSATSPSAKVDAQLLLCFVLEKNTTYLFTWPEKVLESEQLTAFETLIERRYKGEPVAYLTGERGFWTLNLKTNKTTLIPRADTECLVECALQMVTGDVAKVLDLGTGTGAIALALASEKSDWDVHGCDYSEAAVELAQKNAEILSSDGCDTQVTLVQSDWFSAYGSKHLSSFDLIVSNPPYIDKDDIHLGQGDLRFEPASALVADNHGLADIFHIVKQARVYLKPGGWLMIEHGFDQGAMVRQRFEDQGFCLVRSEKDLAKNERFTIGCMAIEHM